MRYNKGDVIRLLRLQKSFKQLNGASSENMMYFLNITHQKIKKETTAALFHLQLPSTSRTSCVPQVVQKGMSSKMLSQPGYFKQNFKSGHRCLKQAPSVHSPPAVLCCVQRSTSAAALLQHWWHGDTHTPHIAEQHLCFIPFSLSLLRAARQLWPCSML